MTVKVGVVGLGWWGRRIAELIQGQQQGMVLAGVTDVNTSVCNTFADEFSVQAYPTYESLINAADIDAVILTSPHRFHSEQIIAAAAAGKHVFCEKPLSMTRSDAERAIQACQQYGVRLGVGHERRFEASLVYVREQISKGKLGTLLQFEGNFSHDLFIGMDPNNWRFSKEEAGCGPMTATGIHLLDFAVSLGGGAERVYAVNTTLSTPFASGDSMSTLITLANGATATINCMLSTPFSSRLTVFGDQGWIEVKDKSHVQAPTGWIITEQYKDQPVQITELLPNMPVLDNLYSFARAIEGEQEDYAISLDDMLRTVAALEAVFVSAETKETVVVQPV